MRTALLAELKIVRTGVSENIKESENADDSTAAYAPTDVTDDMYRTFSTRIGLLSDTEVAAVMNAYLTLRQYATNLFLIGVPAYTTDNLGDPVHSTDRLVNVPPQNLKALTAMQAGLHTELDKAISALEQGAE